MVANAAVSGAGLVKARTGPKEVVQRCLCGWERTEVADQWWRLYTGRASGPDDRSQVGAHADPLERNLLSSI